MASVSTLIERMRYWVNDADLGYDQGERQNIFPHGECDCSSLVIRALQESGFDTGSASYTGDLSENLTARGWSRLPVDGNPQPGDIVLNDAEHVAVCTAPHTLAYASIDERGCASGGQTGDQTGLETKEAPYYDHPWDCYLRFTGQPGPAPTPGTGGMYVCVADCVRIRTAPTINSDAVGEYYRGQTVILDDNFVEADGCVWGTYISYSQNRRYIAISQNGEPYFQHC